MTSVLLLDDHPLIVSGLAAYLSSRADVDVIGQVYSPEQALTFLEKTPADVLVSDMSFDNTAEGIELMLALREKHQNVRVVFYSMIEKADEVRQVIVAGANAYVLKKYDADEVYRAIQAVRKRQLYYSPELVPILAQAQAPAAPSDEQPEQVRSLTQREREIMECIADGLSTKKIAEQLFIADSTVQTHRSNLMTKLNVDSNVGIIHYAFKYGIVKRKK